MIPNEHSNHGHLLSPGLRSGRISPPLCFAPSNPGLLSVTSGSLPPLGSLRDEPSWSALASTVTGYLVIFPAPWALLEVGCLKPTRSISDNYSLVNMLILGLNSRIVVICFTITGFRKLSDGILASGDGFTGGTLVVADDRLLPTFLETLISSIVVIRDCPDQTDSSNHVTLWDGSNYKRAA